MISIGIILSSILIYCFGYGLDQLVDYRYAVIFVNIILLIPCLLDGGLQIITKYKSSNFLRVITGYLAGFAVRNLVFLILHY